MATVVHLAAGENPPEGDKWVMVLRDEAVRSGTNITQHSDGATFAVSQEDADPNIAIAQACEWADDNSIPTVYVRLAD